MTPQIATLHDSSGAMAEILVSLGFNCFRLRAVVDKRPVEVIYAPADFAAGQMPPSKGGMPILFPFPGRIAGTIFRWEGKEYPLQPGDAFGNAIHGFALSRPWRVIEHRENRIVGEFHAWRDDPSLKERWPADFRLTATYTLAAHTLKCQYKIENPCDVPLPCGFGVHPYFHVPLGGASADDCLVKLPVTARWELKDKLPTGQRLELPNADQFAAGQRFGELSLDDVFTGLVPKNVVPENMAPKNLAPGKSSVVATSVHDPSSGLTMTQTFDPRTFRECVVFTPPSRAAICLEPYTCVPDCFDLEKRGIDAGLRIVPPGQSFSTEVEIRVSTEG
jgi:aldose 1-epimerase